MNSGRIKEVALMWLVRLQILEVALQLPQDPKNIMDEK